ncbi:MAG: glutathione peroxidase [Terracidiphilus sp.]
MVLEDSIYNFSALLLDGSLITLDRFHNKVLLVVNTASQCGFTPQYAGLEQLYETYGDRGFAVLAFPCNQFGAQEPGTNDQIGAFCQKNYGVSFPVFAKIDVNGPNTHPLYGFLKARKAGLFGFRRISWNFTKFLIDPNGNVASRYWPSKQPKDLAPAIERLLTDI